MVNCKMCHLEKYWKQAACQTFDLNGTKPVCKHILYYETACHSLMMDLPKIWYGFILCL
jgi:hypothetical protein